MFNMRNFVFMDSDECIYALGIKKFNQHTGKKING